MEYIDSSLLVNVREAVLECLQAVLDPHDDVRKAGEEHLRVLEVKDEFCVTLCDVITDTSMPQSIRQLASVVLKHYVEIHWSKLAEKFVEPEPSERVKQIVRRSLPAALSDPEARIRSTVAYAISAIAQWDWPEAWPDILDTLITSLSSGDANLIHGVLSVLTEFAAEVTDIQMPLVAPLIFPHLYNIITNVEVYSIQNRRRAVEIFTGFSAVIGAMAEIHKDAASTLLFPVLSQFLETFIQCFSVSDESFVNSGLKKDILEAIVGLMNLFPSQVSAHFSRLLPKVWDLLTSCADRYVRMRVNCGDLLDYIEDDEQAVDFENLIYAVFLFIETLMALPKFRVILKRSVDQLVPYLLVYLQITDDQVSTWLGDPNRFVEDEDEDTLSYSVRIAAENLLLSLCDEKQLAFSTAKAVTVAIIHHMEMIKNSQTDNNWKMYESCMLALGDVHDVVSTGKTGFDVLGFLSSVVLKQLTSDVSPFLIGRCLWLSSKFAGVMPHDLCVKFVEACVSGLGETFHPAIRVSAVRGLQGFCSHLDREKLQPYLSAAVNELVTLATQSDEGVLELVLDVMLVAIKVDQQLTASLESRLSPLAIALFLKYSHDPSMMSIIEELFAALAANPLVLQPLQARVFPTLVSILKASQGNAVSGLISSCLDVLVPIIRNSNPLQLVFVTELFPLVVNRTVNTDDNSVMQSGCDCLRAYVAKAVEQLASWHDDRGHSGIEYVVEVASQLLEPGRSEFSALLIGRLISTLVHKAGQYLSGAIEPLLRSVLSKLQQAQTQSVIQSLLVVFAQLMISQLEDVLKFLESVPSPTGDSALQFVLTVWCQWQPYFYGAYETKVSVIALGKLLEYGVKSTTRQLWDIAVKGEELMSVSQSQGIRTRSKVKKVPVDCAYTMVPAPVKVYKLLLNEVQSLLEFRQSQQAELAAQLKSKLSNDRDDDEWEDASGDDEDEEEEENGFIPLDEALVRNLADDEESEDEDATEDPTYHVDLLVYLKELITSFLTHPSYADFDSHLTPMERQNVSQLVS